jgi:hypothetical protein
MAASGSCSRSQPTHQFKILAAPQQLFFRGAGARVLCTFFREVPYLPVTINRKTRSPLAFLLRQLEGQFKRLSVSRKRNDSKDLDLIHCKIQKPITTLDFPRVIGTTGSVTSEWSLGESERSTSASSPARRIPPSDGRGHRSVRGRSLVERGFIDRSRRGGMCACEQR